MMDKEAIDKILKIAIVILLIVLLIVMRVYKLDSCDLIKEKTEGLGQGQVVSLYYEKCLSEYRVKLNESSLNNISIIWKP